MGADASAYLYVGIPFSDVYEELVSIEEYDKFNERTGEKTGIRGTDTKKFFVNKHTKQLYPHNYEELGIADKYIQRMDQEDRDAVIIGIKVKSISDGGYKFISEMEMEAVETELNEMLIPHLLTGDGRIALVEPKLILNLYWSF
jgi:hypothetical protein